MIEQCISQILLPKKAISVGDFNAHHPWWNCDVKTPKRVCPIINATDMPNLKLINEEDIPIYHNRNGTGTSILDLTFAIPSSTDCITGWVVDDKATTGSDHEVIRFEFNTSLIEDTVTYPVYQQFSFKKADWTQFNNTL